MQNEIHLEVNTHPALSSGSRSRCGYYIRIATYFLLASSAQPVI